MSKSTTHVPPHAVPYATSLLELALEKNLAPQIGAELRDIQGILKDSPSLKLFLADPTVDQATRGELVKKMFSGQVQPLVLNFLGLLNRRKRLSDLSAVIDTYHELLDTKLGKIEVDITVAQRLSDEQLSDVSGRVGRALGRNAVVHQYVDESIIGGMILRVGDKLIDGSIKTQLNAIRDDLRNVKRK
jgi:F-type H+-transporting ATPase subunit delta